MILNCDNEYVTTDPYNLIYNYCVSTGEQDTAAAGGKGGSGTVTTTFTARPSQTPTDTPVANPCMLSMPFLRFDEKQANE